MSSTTAKHLTPSNFLEAKKVSLAKSTCTLSKSVAKAQSKVGIKPGNTLLIKFIGLEDGIKEVYNKLKNT
jgi:hypothetical protein